MTMPAPRTLTVTNPDRPGSEVDAVPRPPFLATTLGMMIAIPALVAAAAISALGLYHLTMQSGLREATIERLAGQALLSRQRVELALGQSAALADGVATWAAHADLGAPEPLVRALVAMADGRPGIVQVYLAGSDGGLLGVLRHDGGWRMVRLAPGPTGARRTEAMLGPDGTATPAASDDGIPFDARLRPWYTRAVAASGTIWTGPYAFAHSGRTGVTASRRLDGPGGRLRAVVGVDIDPALLGAHLQRQGDLGRTLVIGRDHEVVAAPAELLPVTSGQAVPTIDRLRDPTLRGLLEGAAEPADDRPVPLTAGGDVVGSVQRLGTPGGDGWMVVQYSDRDEVAGVMGRARSRAMAGAGVLVAAGILAGAFFARLLAGARRQAEAQRLRAQHAEARAHALGSYTLVRRIGEGGMGEVWVGEHRLLSRPAAVKLISAQKLDGRSDEFRQRFIREAQTTASLRARSTIRLFDFGIAPDGTCYYVMELLDGLDLRQLVVRHGPAPAGRVVAILVQALGSLAEAHDRGLVHRDIKPENLFLCRYADEVDVVKVLDFGLVAPVAPAADTRLTAAGMVNGTPGTMSPEQALGRALDGRSDLYSLGCVAYWLLTGREVFAGDSAVELMAQHIGAEVPDPRRITPGIPDDLARIVLDCLAKDPGMRPAGAREMAAALARASIPAGQAWPADAAADWWRRLDGGGPAPAAPEGPPTAGTVIAFDGSGG